MTELNSCPLCKQREAEIVAGRGYAVKCHGCWKIRIGDFNTKEDAAAAWNSLSPQITPEMVERAATAIRTGLPVDGHDHRHEYLAASTTLAKDALEAALQQQTKEG
jgi:hypothetical protein